MYSDMCLAGGQNKCAGMHSELDLKAVGLSNNLFLLLSWGPLVSFIMDRGTAAASQARAAPSYKAV